MRRAGRGAATAAAPRRAHRGLNDRRSSVPNAFGFEAEFERGAHDLARRLHELNLVATPDIHYYHCDCQHCAVASSNYPLRVQADATVDGEVISSPQVSWTSARRLMTALEQAAVDVDAEPGWEAGFHVHVDAPPSPAEQANALWAYLLWEDVLRALAAGRFTEVRAANEAVTDVLAHRLTAAHDNWCGGPLELAAVEHDLGGDALHSLQHTLLASHRASDRHSCLNLRTRFSTWEFRLWNSTRSAWRMELWCRLSTALVDPAAVAALRYAAVATVDGNLTVGRLVRLLGDTLAGVGHTRAAELVARQWHYADTLAESAPPAFAAF